MLLMKKDYKIFRFANQKSANTKIENKISFIFGFIHHIENLVNEIIFYHIIL